MSRSTHVARVVTETTSPAVASSAQLLLAAWYGSDDPLSALGWWLLASMFGSALPLAYLLRGVQIGRWTNHHIPVRQQRLVPMTFGLLCMVAGVAVLAIAGAPRALTMAFAIMTTLLTVLIVITNWWKISAHTALVAGTAALVVALFGPLLLVTWPVILATGWSRLQLKAHTLAQVVVGGLLGVGLTGPLAALTLS